MTVALEGNSNDQFIIITIHPEGNINVYTKMMSMNHGNLCNSCRDISSKTTNVGLTDSSSADDECLKQQYRCGNPQHQ